MTEIQKQELQLELMQAQVGMPKNYSYTSVIREMLPNEIGEKRIKEIQMVWNRRRFNENDIRLLIKVCKMYKDSIK